MPLTERLPMSKRPPEGVIEIADDAAEVTSGTVRVASESNLDRIEGILGRIDSAAAELETTLKSANRATLRVENALSDENIGMVTDILTEMKSIQNDIGEIVGANVTTSENVQKISEFSQDRLDGFLQRMGSVSDEYRRNDGRLRDDPSLIIRGSE